MTPNKSTIGNEIWIWIIYESCPSLYLYKDKHMFACSCICYEGKILNWWYIYEFTLVDGVFNGSYIYI